MESEIQVFFAGLERGAATIRQLSEDTRMGRITVHEITRRLIKK
jgi:predicted transcriptional regulator